MFCRRIGEILAPPGCGLSGLRVSKWDLLTAALFPRSSRGKIRYGFPIGDHCAMLMRKSTDAISGLPSRRPATPLVLFQGDCRELLTDLPEDSVGLIISSPPYFMGKEYDRSDRHDDFTKEHRELAPLLSRVLRPGGSLCWQTGMHVHNGTVVPLDFLAYEAFSKDSSLALRNRIVWHFEHGVHARKRFSGRHETILWFTKGNDYTFNLDAVRVPQKYPGKRHYKGPNKGKLSGHPAGKNPGDMWAIPQR